MHTYTPRYHDGWTRYDDMCSDSFRFSNNTLVQRILTCGPRPPFTHEFLLMSGVCGSPNT